MTNVENVELRTGLCTICDWRSSSYEDQSPSNINNLEKRKVALLARALREKLPKNFKHVICKPQSNEYAEPDVCVLRTNCQTQVEVDTWVSNYSRQSGFKWDKQNRIVSVNRKVKELYRCKYVCHEPTFDQTLCAKQTETQHCPASITVVIKSGKSGVTDEHINSFPTVVRLRGDHSCFFGKSLQGGKDCVSSVHFPESEIRTSNVLLQTVAQIRENGTGEVKKVTNVKKDPHISLRITSNINSTSLLAKKISVKKETISGNVMDVGVTAKVEAVNQDGKITVNNSLHLSKENTSLGVIKGTIMSKEALEKNTACKAKIIHGKPSAPSGVTKVLKKPLILNKGNRIVVQKNNNQTGSTEAEGHAEKRLEKMEAATMKAPNPVTTKRKHEEINGPNTKNKKARIEDRKPCVKHVHRIECSKKTSPKKTQEETAILVVQTTDCTPQTINEPKSLETPTQFYPKSPTKVAEQTVKPQPVADVDEFGSLVAKFDALFAQNHEPATALATHIVDLQLNEGSNWRDAACPDLAWCQSRFDTSVNEPRITTPQTTLTALTEFSELCSANDVCRVESVAGGGFVGVIVTELMRRNAETNPNAAGVNYVLPYHGTTSQLFLVMCDSEGGGLPLAIMITSDMTPSVLAPAVRLLTKHARLSPRLWLVPDKPTLRNAFVEGFPDASVRLSLALLLKDAWQFALRETSRVPETHQVLLYQYVVHLIGCPSELALLYQLKVALSNPVNGLETFCQYLNGVYVRRNEWAVYLRDSAFREVTLEAEIAVSKASVFTRLYDFDTVHLVHFALTRLDMWYENRMRAVQSRTHVDQPITNASMPADVKLTTLSDGVKLVQFVSEGVEHVVNDIVGVCSCLKGNAGWCRHQLAVCLGAKVDTLPGPVDVLRLVPLEPVQVDTSMPEIFPESIVGGSGSGVWGPVAVEGKRVRKLPPKLKVDLGAFGPPKKQKGEKKEKKGKVDEVMPELEKEVDDSVGKDIVCVQVVKKVAIKAKPKVKQSPVAARIPINGLGDRDYGVKKARSAKKAAAKSDAKDRLLPDKRASVPGDFFAGNFGKGIAYEGLEDGVIPGKKFARRKSSDSSGSQTKTVHFAPFVHKKLGRPSAEHKNILNLIKLIKRDISMCYALNPNLKEKICELYQAMHPPVVEPLSILKQTLVSGIPPTPAEELAVEVQQDVEVKQEVEVELNIEVEQDVEVKQDVEVEPDIEVQVVSSFQSSEVKETADISDIPDIVSVENVEETVEEIVLSEEIVPAFSDLNLSRCFVSLSAFDVEKYKLPDGSYSFNALM